MSLDNTVGLAVIMLNLFLPVSRWRRRYSPGSCGPASSCRSHLLASCYISCARLSMDCSNGTQCDLVWMCTLEWRSPRIKIDLHGSCTASIIHKHCFRNAAWLLYTRRALATPICYVRNCSSITHCLVCASVWNRLIPECKLSEVLDVTNPLQFTLWTPQAKE